MDYLAIGHITVDRLEDGPAAGGSAAYACLTAARLGLRAAMATVAGEELDWSRWLPGVEIARWPAPATTTFENRYSGDQRTQRVLAMAEPVPVGIVPSSWRDCAMVHLAPVVHEVGAEFGALFADSLICLTPQGLLRHWDRDGAVRQGSWVGDAGLLSRSGVVVLSEGDLQGDPSFLPLCLERVPVVIVTRGARGATLYVRGRPTHLPAFPVSEVDPTGAGDVFAAAFLIEYHRTGDPFRATAFACCAASFVVERRGLEGVPPSRRAVEDRLARYERPATGN